MKIGLAFRVGRSYTELVTVLRVLQWCGRVLFVAMLYGVVPLAYGVLTAWLFWTGLE